MAKILKKIFDIILVLIIIVLALYFVLRLDNRIRIYNVMTGSMEDNIHAGDYILIVKCGDYKVGDVVTFSKEGYYITHRIIKIEGSEVTTKGDANNVEDATINKSSIIGKAVLIGGVLNIIINYKFSIVGILLATYLLTCYLEKDSKEEEKTIENKDESIEEKELEDEKIEEKVEEKVEEEIKETQTVTKTKRKKKEKVIEEASAIEENPVKKKTGKKKEKIVEEIFAMEEKPIKKKAR